MLTLTTKKSHIVWFVFCIGFWSPLLWGASKDPLSVDLPELPVVPGASSQWIGKQMAVNGLPASLRQFVYEGTIEDVQRFYESYWKTRGHGQTSVSRLGGDLILGNILRGFYQSVQLTRSGETIAGQLMVTLAPDKQVHLDKVKTTFPVMPGNRIVRVVESLDGDQRSETIIMNSQRSVIANIDYIKRQFYGDDWKVIKSSNSDSMDLGSSGKATLQRQGELIDVVAFPKQSGMRDGCQLIVTRVINQ